jgi:hypothetical protein
VCEKYHSASQKIAPLFVKRISHQFSAINIAIPRAPTVVPRATFDSGNLHT